MTKTGQYWVQVCRNCHHPGGMHVIDQWGSTGSVQRAAFVLGDFAKWSDARSRELTQ